jgi:hypothetical protein
VVIKVADRALTKCCRGLVAGLRNEVSLLGRYQRLDLDSSKSSRKSISLMEKFNSEMVDKILGKSQEN